jgi:predicted transcriptional regulator of viral defense system
MRQGVQKKIEALAGRRGVIRPRDLVAIGIPREYASRMAADGSLVRVGRGLYRLPDAVTSSTTSLAEVATSVPSGVICLVSALVFHGMTTQPAPEVWVAVPNKAWRSRSVAWPVRFVYMGEEAMRAGVERHEIESVRVRIFSPAKTVADCFKYRNKVGLDVAMEALRNYVAKTRSVDELWRHAKVCRVTRVIAPYLEAMA